MNTNDTSKRKIDCTLETRLSKKNTVYQCLVIKLTDTLEKVVFLEPAEAEVLNITKK